MCGRDQKEASSLLIAKDFLSFWVKVLCSEQSPHANGQPSENNRDAIETVPFVQAPNVNLDLHRSSRCRLSHLIETEAFLIIS